MMIGHRASSTRTAMLAVALVVTTAVALVASAVTGASTHATVTLKFVAQSNGQGNPQLQAILDRFQQLNPDIKVDATYLPIGTTYANTLRTQLQGGNGPDVFYVTAGSGGLQSVLPLAKAGYVADLSKRPWVEDDPARARERPLFWRQGRLTALPFDVVPVGVMYHTDVLAEPRDRGAEDDEPVPRRVPDGEGEGQVLPEPRRRVGAERLALRDRRRRRATCSRRIPAGTSSASPARRRSRARPRGASTLQRIVDMKNAGCFPPGAEANDNIPATPGFVSGQVVGWTLPSSIVAAAEGLQQGGEVQLLRDARRDCCGHARLRVADRRIRRVVEVAEEGGGVQADRLYGDPRRHGPLRRAHGRRVAVPGRAPASTSSFELRGLGGFLKVNSKVLPADEPRVGRTRRWSRRWARTSRASSPGRRRWRRPSPISTPRGARRDNGAPGDRRRPARPTPVTVADV